MAVGVETDYSGLPTRLLLLVDPTTGRPLGREDILTTDAGALGVEVPAVIGYEAYLAADRVDETAVPQP